MINFVCWLQLYIEGRDGNLVEENEICACRPGTVELTCAMISPVPDTPCNTDNIFYRSDKRIETIL